MARSAAVVVLLLLLVPAAVAAERVAQVTIEGASPEQRQEVLSLLGLEEGATLDRARLREGIRALYATGDVADLRVLAEPTADGLHLTVVLAPRPRLGAVAVTGVEGALRRRVRGWLRLDPDEVVTDEALAAARRRAEQELRERGWHEALIELESRVNPDGTVDVTAVVRPGTRQRLAQVRVEGVVDADGAIVAAAGSEAGAALTAELVDRVERRVAAAVRRGGHWEAEITGTRRVLTARGIDLVVEVAPGPRWELVLEAPAGSRELVRELLPDPAAADAHPAQTEVLQGQLREALQRRHHLLPEVAVHLEPGEEVQRLVVRADPGPRLKVGRVRFEGAATVAAERLRAAVAAGRGRRAVTDVSLAADRLALEELFRRQGLPDVVVAPARLEPGAPGEVDVVFAIDEGRQVRLADLLLEGVPVEALAELERTPPELQEGDLWEPRRAEAARRQVEEVLSSAGYPDASVRLQVEREPGRARVRLLADAGPFVEVEEIVVAGLERTDAAVVRRELARSGVVAGAPWSLRRQLEAQRRLYELGIFRRVELGPLPGQGRETRRTLLVRLEEGEARSYLLGLGWDTANGARVSVGWSHLNLFGGAHAVSLEARVSGREQRVQATLREPHLWWLGAPAFATVYRTEEEFAAFSQLRRGLWLEVGDRRHRGWRPWVRYEYQIVRPDAPPEVLSELERQDREIQLASVRPALEWDTRDDLFVPERGHLASVAVEYAFPAFAADAHFLKLETVTSLYRRLPFGIGAAGLRLGAIEPLADGGGPANLQVPLGVRFFAGGRISHRAFPTDGLGVPGQTLDAAGEPIGGNALLLLNLEYRRPVWDALSAVAFVDGGNLWAEPAAVRWRDVRWGAGLGLRYDTPAGPIRLEYGHKLDREEGESSGELYLSFGTPF